MTKAIARVHPFHLINAEWVPGGANPHIKPTDLGCEWAATIHIHHLHFVLLLGPKANTHLTIPRRVEGWVDLGTAIWVCIPCPRLCYCSGCHDKHNWLRPLTLQPVMLPLRHCDLQRHGCEQNSCIHIIQNTTVHWLIVSYKSHLVSKKDLMFIAQLLQASVNNQFKWKIQIQELKVCCLLTTDKSSAVAEMGDCLATIDMGRKVGRGCCGGAGSPLCHHPTQCGLGQGLPLYQVASWSIQPFGHDCRNATLLRVGIPSTDYFYP